MLLWVLYHSCLHALHKEKVPERPSDLKDAIWLKECSPFHLAWHFVGFYRTLQRVRLANRGRLLLRTPGPVPFGTCICSNVETILSWTCHVYGPFEFRTSLCTSILLRRNSSWESKQSLFCSFKCFSTLLQFLLCFSFSFLGMSSDSGSSTMVCCKVAEES